MKFPLSFVVIIVIASFCLNSCSDEPSSIGIDYIGDELLIVSTFDTKDDSVFQSSSYFKKVVPLGLSSKILIGKKDDVEASTLMSFLFIVSDSLKQDFLDDVILVNESFVKLTPVYTFTDEAESFDFTVHKINNSWSFSGFTADSLASLSYDEEDLSSNKNFTDSLYTFNLDNNLVLSWIKSSIDTSLGKNYGIYYKPTMTSGKVVGFQAYTTTTFDAAKIKIVIEKPGSYIDTISGLISVDASAVTGDLPVLPAGDMGAQSSLTVQSKLFFDLSEMPGDVVINSADLIITEDTLNSLTGSSYTGGIRAYRITDSLTTTLDEQNTVLMPKNNNSYLGNITRFINSWVNEGNNQGLVLKPSALIEGLELFVLKGSTHSDISERPRLRIVYTSKKK